MDVSSTMAAMVDQLRQRGHIRTEAVEAAFRVVPRHLFLPEIPAEEAYQDKAFLTKSEDGTPLSSSSQPTIMAGMLELLEPRPGDRVLEIGAATGYNAALLAHIVGERGRVVTIDIDEDLVAGARHHLAAAGYPQVQVIRGDGAEGYAPVAPYDRIIVTVGAWDIAPAWFEQLGPGGRLVLPLSINSVDVATAFERGDGCLISRGQFPCIFMPMRGRMAGPPTHVHLSDKPRITLCLDNADVVDAAAAYQALRGPYHDHSTGVRAKLPEQWAEINCFVRLRESDAGRLAQLVADAEATRSLQLPDFVGVFDRVPEPGANTTGLVTSDSLAMLTRPNGSASGQERPDVSQPVEVLIRSYGPSGEDLARRLVNHVQEWDRAGQPGAGPLHIRACPVDAPYELREGQSQLLKRSTRLVLSAAPPPDKKNGHR